jgi:signal transduction histidine kinase
MQTANATNCLPTFPADVEELVGGELLPPQPAASTAAAIAVAMLGMSGRQQRMTFGSFRLRAGQPWSVEGRVGECAVPRYTPVTVLCRCYARCGIVSAVKIARPLAQPILRVLHPQPTVRWRLTLLYSVLFLMCSAALLAITYWLFTKYTFGYYPPRPNLPLYGKPPNPAIVRFAEALSRQRSVDLHNLRVGYGVALAIMAVVSGVLGWVVAGRVLAPLRTITATAERISDTNLNERLAMSGPRDELRLLADTIDRLLERLETAFDAQRRFVANASHDLRTPLAMMRTTLDVAIAKPGGVPAQTRELDADLRVDLDDADRLLESFLTLARAQNGQLDERSQVALEPLITAALAVRAGQITAKRLTVESHLAAVEVAGSATLLRRMVENVIENAVHHNQPGGSIELTLTLMNGQHARLIIDSSGPMLDQSAVAELAQPFRRLGQDRIGSRNGHGLGLSIVAAVAAAHDGSLELYARAQGGLRVQITLAAATPQLPGTVR